MNVCECCGDVGMHAGCTLLPGVVICRRCVMVWYDGGGKSKEEIGKESRFWRDTVGHWSRSLGVK